MTAISVLGIDLGKTSCSMAGLDNAGKAALRRRVQRDVLGALLGKLPPCVVAMEACCGAHFVGRAAQAQGHQVRLMPPGYGRPYEGAEERRSGCGGDRRGGDTADDALRAAQGRGGLAPLSRTPLLG